MFYSITYIVTCSKKAEHTRKREREQKKMMPQGPQLFIHETKVNKQDVILQNNFCIYSSKYIHISYSNFLKPINKPMGQLEYENNCGNESY